MKKLLSALGFCGVLLAAGPVQAGGSHWGFGLSVGGDGFGVAVGSGGGYVAWSAPACPPPVRVYGGPVHRPPVIVCPPPVMVVPRAPLCPPPPVFGGHRHGHWVPAPVHAPPFCGPRHVPLVTRAPHGIHAEVIRLPRHGR